MKLLIIFFTLSAAIGIVAAAYLDDYNHQELEIDESEAALPETQEATSLRGVRRLTAKQSLLAIGVCDKFPRVCRLKTSPGPDCCKKKCVNVKNDRGNCGKCGYKCKYTEICCSGQCVNVSFDKRHCGGCKNKCKKGEFCVYGMCNYA